MVALIPIFKKLVHCEFKGASVVELRKPLRPFMMLEEFTVYFYDNRLWVLHPFYYHVYLCIGKSVYKSEVDLMRNLQLVFKCLKIKRWK